MSIFFDAVKQISRDTSAYPINIADIKKYSRYFRDNPTDTSLDDYLNNVVIPQVVTDFEYNTHYIILNTTLELSPSRTYCFFDLGSISYLNLRTIDNIKYYPIGWNEEDNKTILSTNEYIVISEQLNLPAQVFVKKEYKPIYLYDIQYNINLTGSFGFIDVADTPRDIKDCIAMQCADVIDVERGICEEKFYDARVRSVYYKYSVSLVGDIEII